MLTKNWLIRLFILISTQAFVLPASSSPLFLRENKSRAELSACRDLRVQDAAVRARWLQRLASGSPEHALISSEMMELGLLPHNPELQQKRLLLAFHDQRAKYNLLFVTLRSYDEGQASAQQVAAILRNYRHQDFSGEIGGRAGYLFYLLAQRINYQDAALSLEALRMALGSGIPEAAQLLYDVVATQMPEKLQDKSFVDFFRVALTRVSNRNAEAMRLRGRLWASGVFGSSEEVRQYYGDLYETVGQMMYVRAGLVAPGEPVSYYQGSQPKEHRARIEADAAAYLRAHAARHQPTEMFYELACNWQ